MTDTKTVDDDIISIPATEKSADPEETESKSLLDQGWARPLTAIFATFSIAWIVSAMTDGRTDLPKMFALLKKLLRGGVIEAIAIDVASLAICAVLPAAIRKIRIAAIRRAAYAAFQAFLLSVPPIVLWRLHPDYGPLAGATLAIQHAIDVMKSHSMYTLDGPDSAVTVARALRFAFLPSLVYREDHFVAGNPLGRTKKGCIEILRLARHALLATISFTVLYLVLYLHMIPAIRGYPESGFFATWMRMMFPSLAAYYASFYGVIHCAQNFVGELSGHRDRSFYEDWWSADGFGDWMRKWNSTVQRWMAQVYVSIRKPSAPGSNRVFSLFFVLILSGLWHDYCIWITFRQFSLWTTFAMCILFVVVSITRTRFGAAILGNCAFLHIGLLLGFGMFLMFPAVCATWVDSPVCLPHQFFRVSGPRSESSSP
jgi:hypothetical protein